MPLARFDGDPDHLFLGTQIDNMHDRASKRREAFGESNGSAKLTNEQIDAIRCLAGTMSNRKIARCFGVSNVHVGDVISGKYR